MLQATFRLNSVFLGLALDFERVVLDPAWLRIDLPVFFLSDGNDARGASIAASQDITPWAQLEDGDRRLKRGSR
jgi:hypothetical protein